MRIAILTLGTRGDVQPYVALGLGLQRAGHSVTLGTSLDFENFVCSQGLGFSPFRLNFREILADSDGRAALDSKRAAIRIYRKVGRLMPTVLDDAWKATEGAHAILYHPKILNGLDIAEKRNIPAMLAFYLPVLSPTRAFPMPLLPGPATWGGFLNKLSHKLFLRLMCAPYFQLVNRWRTQGLGLPPRSIWSGATHIAGKPIPKLYGYSRHLIPTPGDWDGSNHNHVTGQWFLNRPADWQAPPGIVSFLAAGAPPVFVGFGSIAGRNPEATTAVVLEALRLSGQKGVLASGWGGLAAAQVPDTVCFVESVPHNWLFPQVAAVVHHGGAGTTAEGLRAGKPTVICPFFGDQPFWGRRVLDLGVGPRPIPQKRLTAQRLAEAIRVAVTDEGMRLRATGLGAKIRTEDGVGQAVRVIEEELGRAEAGLRDHGPGCSK